MLRPMWMDVPRSHLSLWVIGDARFRPSCIFLSLPFSLYTHNTHEIFTQSIPPWTISMAQLVPRVEVLRWRRRRIYAMYAISLLLLLSSTSAMIFIDSGALLREESMEDGKMPGPCFQRFAMFQLSNILILSYFRCLFKSNVFFFCLRTFICFI